jgi:cytochrome c556
MLRFRNIPEIQGLDQRRWRLLGGMFLIFLAAAGTSLAQKKNRGADSVRTDEKGRKFVNKIPFDVFFDDPLSVARNKDAVNSPASPAEAPASDPKTPSTNSPSSSTPPSKSAGIDWKELMPVEELQGEVKSIRNNLTKSMANQGSYKSNFKEVAIEGAELAALAAILQAHPESLSWKDKAQYVRDLGAQLNQSAVGLSKENFENSKSAFQKLSSVLDGSVPNDAGDVPETRPFNEAASRKGLMKRIERAKNFLQQDINSEAKFKSLADQARHEAAIIAALGTVITTPGYDYTEEDDYQKHASSLINGGKEATAAMQDEAFDRFKQAVDKINKSCSDCHGSYGT